MDASIPDLLWTSKKVKGVCSLYQAFHCSIPVRQMNMDYAFSQAMKYKMVGIPGVISFYDVMCQYWRNLEERFNRSPYLELPPMEYRRGIGEWHIHGHQRQCFARFSPNYIEGAGQVDGEVIETLWTPLNLISPSTRAASAAHRQEVLDDHMGHSNWKKLVKMGEFRIRLDILCNR